MIYGTKIFTKPVNHVNHRVIFDRQLVTSTPSVIKIVASIITHLFE